MTTRRANKALQRDPDYLLAHLRLTINYAHMGRGVDAQALAAEVRRLIPKFSGESYAKTRPFKNQGADPEPGEPELGLGVAQWH